MKKIVVLLLALAFVLTLAGTALAASVSASYDDGTITVSGSVDDNRSYMILIDGAGTGYRISAKAGITSNTFKKTLEPGSHTVSLFSELTGETVASSSFTVAGGAPTTPPETEPPVTEPPETEPPVTEPPVTDPTDPPVTEPPVTEPPVTEEPISGPVKLTSASYKNGVISFSVNGLTAGSAEIWLDGDAIPVGVHSNGSYTFNKRLSEGSHTLTVYVPVNGEIDNRTFDAKVLDPKISASYTQVGKLAVTVSDLNAPSEIWVDGAAIALNVKADGTYTANVTLKEGTHTVSVYDPLNGKTGTTTVTVDHIWQITPAKDATCTEDGNTEGKVCLNPDCGKVESEYVVIPALGHDVVADAGKVATCTAAGLTDGSHCARCGEVLEAQVEIPALGHKYVMVNKTVSGLTYKCQRCGDTFTVANNSTVKNGYGAIVMDANMVNVDYTAAANTADKKILVIVADLGSAEGLTSELGLYLSEELIAQFKKDGFTTVNFINGDASILIDLDAISADWFTTEDTIWNYVFSTDPAAEGGILVKVEAQISGTEKVEADAFSGVTLKKADGDVAVTANGIY